MFTFTLDKNKKIPLYQQLYEHIKQQIIHKNLQPGDKLPSKRKLASHLKISQNTIENAYQQLIAEGYICSIPKKGFFVEKIAEPLENATVPIKQNFHFPTSERKISPAKYDYDFKTNIVNTDYFPFDTWSKIVRQVLADRQENLLKPLPLQGDFNLRNEIAKYLYAYRGILASPEQIIIGAGSEYLLSLLIQLLGTSCTFALENPGYDKIAQIFQNHHLNISYVNTGFQGLDLDSLFHSSAQILHITPSHHFPLGCVMSIDTRRKILNWAYEQEDRFIIEDDYDSEFRFTGRPIPALQSLDQNQKVIYLNTFTKSLAPSLRISYMVLPYQLLSKFNKQFSLYSSTVPSFEQSALALFMNRGHFERHINKMKRLYKGQRDTLIETISHHPLNQFIRIIGEDTGLHLLLEVNIGLTENQLLQIANQKKIHIFGLRQYFHQEVSSIPSNIIILGYSGLSFAAIQQGIQLLLDSWAQATNLI